ncbi:MAG: hypothetical protein E2577_09025, partial [Starkeya sp.]|nr:hypothetical protein [Starkeya sp.]
MALEVYRRKRDFTRTQEPEGTESAAAGHAYLVQKHAARRLHYDLRLEMDGVLKSWAVTKGPSLVPGEKRLAVHVEDHPLDYGTFEGTIPEGEYGGGPVMLWDTGSWEPVGDAARGYKKGHLEFALHGEKLSGRWHLVRMGKRRGEKADNWLLIKAEDAAARPEGAPDVLEERPESVKTGRSMDAIAKGETVAADPPAAPSPTKARAARTRTPAAKKAPASAPLPAFIEPQLATLVSKAPTGKSWIHEIKFDGYRLQARLDKNAKDKGRVKLLTRSGLDWTPRFGLALVAALEALPAKDALIDGELVVENSGGVSNFSLLQKDLAEGSSDRFIYYAFDLLHLDGQIDASDLDVVGDIEFDGSEAQDAAHSCEHEPIAHLLCCLVGGGDDTDGRAEFMGSVLEIVDVTHDEIAHTCAHHVGIGIEESGHRETAAVEARIPGEGAAEAANSDEHDAMAPVE